MSRKPCDLCGSKIDVQRTNPIQEEFSRARVACGICRHEMDALIAEELRELGTVDLLMRPR